MRESISVSENEFKKLSLNFRRVASRFLNCSFDDYQNCLKRFLLFIEESPIINEFINENNTIPYDIGRIIAERKIFDKFELPINESEEIAFIYQMLTFISEQERDIFSIAYGYSSSKKMQDHVDRFNDHVVKPLIDHIVNYLAELKIDMGLDKKNSGTQYNIGEFRGQLNHAEGQANISTNQTYIEANNSNLKDLVSQYKEELNKIESISQEEKEETNEILEAALQEVQSGKPKKIIIKTAIQKLMNVGTVISSGTALFNIGNKLIELLQNFII